MHIPPPTLTDAVFIDTCFNFTHESFRRDEDEVLQRAVQAGVAAMIVPGASVADSAEAVALAARHPGLLRACVGVHPHHAAEWGDADSSALEKLAERNEVVAIGEAGLDYYRDFSPRDRQHEAFERQVELAAKTGLPLFMHQRDAHNDFISILKPQRDKIGNAVLHCFTGEQAMLADYLNLDLHIGVTGWICDERRGQDLCNAVAAIPDDRLMIETDSPYLVPRDLRPQPRRRRNEPAFLPHIAAAVAQCRGVTTTALAKTLVANTLRFYDFDLRH